MNNELEYLTPKQLAERWEYSEAALAKWRKLDRGPAWTRRGYKNIIYPISGVIAHEMENPYLVSDRAE